MPVLTTAKIGMYARGAGFPESEIGTAIGVAMAESGGDTNAHNAKPPDDSYGLWQINMLGSLGPARRKQFGITKNEQLYDPSTNAKAAYMVWKGSGWNAWTTYTSGKYKGGVGQVQDAVGSAASSVPNAVLGVGGALKAGLNSMSDSINNVGKNIFKGFVSTGGVMIGIALVILAIVILAMQSKTGKTAVRGAVKVIK